MRVILLLNCGEINQKPSKLPPSSRRFWPRSAGQPNRWAFLRSNHSKPGFYIEAAQPAKHGQIPILSVIRAGVSTDFGEDYIATYGLGAFSQPELEVDLGSFPTQAGAMLTFGIIRRILAGHFTTEASSVRFGVDQRQPRAAKHSARAGTRR